MATSLDQQVIDKVRRSYLLSEIRSVTPGKSNENLIQQDLESLNGVLEIEGWKQIGVSEGQYVTSFVYVIDGRTRSYNFEIFPSNDVIRYIDSNISLIRQYQGVIVDESSTIDLFNLVVESSEVSGLPDFNSFDFTLKNDSLAHLKFYNRIQDLFQSEWHNYEVFEHKYFKSN